MKPIKRGSKILLPAAVLLCCIALWEGLVALFQMCIRDRIGKTLAEVGALPVDLTFKMTDYSNWKALRDRGQTPEVTYRLQVSYKSEGDPTAE